MEQLFNCILDILVAIIAHYIIKWLDNKIRKDSKPTR